MSEIHDPQADLTTCLLVKITWHGRYYRPDERAEMARDWIENALFDRGDSPGVEIREVTTGEAADARWEEGCRADWVEGRADGQHVPNARRDAVVVPEPASDNIVAFEFARALRDPEMRRRLARIGYASNMPVVPATSRAGVDASLPGLREEAGWDRALVAVRTVDGWDLEVVELAAKEEANAKRVADVALTDRDA